MCYHWWWFSADWQKACSMTCTQFSLFCFDLLTLSVHMIHLSIFCRLASLVLAPVPLSIFRSNSKFDDNSERSSFEYTRPITTIFCTRHTRYSAYRAHISFDALYLHTEYDMSVFLVLLGDLKHCWHHQDKKNYYQNFHQYLNDRN